MEEPVIIGRKDKHYECTRCHRNQMDGVTREDLLVKKVVFLEMGVGGKPQKSRVIEWLCPYCVASDPDWQREPFVAPGAKMYRRVAKVSG